MSKKKNTYISPEMEGVRSLVYSSDICEVILVDSDKHTNINPDAGQGNEYGGTLAIEGTFDDDDPFTFTGRVGLWDEDTDEGTDK